MNDTELRDELERRREARLKSSWQTFPSRNPIASDLSDCRRYMVLRQIAWPMRPVPDLRGLQFIEQGQLAEPLGIEQMRQEGWEIVQQQNTIELTFTGPDGRVRPSIRGKIDGRIVVQRGDLLPFDYKDTSEWTLEAIETEHDLATNSEWSRKWLKQGLVYLLATNEERFLFVLGHRGSRRYVFVHLFNHLDLAEKVVSDAEWTVLEVERLEAAGKATPDAADAEVQAPYHSDYSICRQCWLRDRACFPPDPGRSKKASVQPTLEPLVHELLEAKPYHSAYEKLRKQIKARTEGAAVTIAGPYVIEGEVKARKMSAQPAKPEHVQEYWTFEIRRVGE